MGDLNEKILEMKQGKMSLRKIAKVVGLTHEAVRKRLKGLEDKIQVSTKSSEHELTGSTHENEWVSTSSKPCISRPSEESKITVNPKAPSHIPASDVNPSGKRSNTLQACLEGIFSGAEDLFGAIREFLETNGIELYRMNVEPEAYQVKYNGQTIRFYVQRDGVGNKNIKGE